MDFNSTVADEENKICVKITIGVKEFN